MPANSPFVTDAALIVRGTILTMEARRPVAEAFAVGGGRGLEIGTEEQGGRWRGGGRKGGGAIDRTRARIPEARQGEWIVGRGWDESAWPVKRYLNRQDLDSVSVSHPVLVNRVDGHMCSVNSVVLL